MAEEIITLPEAEWERLKRLSLSWLHALYDGVPGQEEMDSDADVIRAVADWLDKADDASDRFLAEHGTPRPVERGVQGRLRRIADGFALSLRSEDVDWVARLRDTKLYQCGYWLGGESICMLPDGHEKHDAREDPR